MILLCSQAWGAFASCFPTPISHFDVCEQCPALSLESSETVQITVHTLLPRPTFVFQQFPDCICLPPPNSAELPEICKCQHLYPSLPYGYRFPCDVSGDSRNFWGVWRSCKMTLRGRFPRTDRHSELKFSALGICHVFSGGLLYIFFITSWSILRDHY